MAREIIGRDIDFATHKAFGLPAPATGDAAATRDYADGVVTFSRVAAALSVATTEVSVNGQQLTNVGGALLSTDAANAADAVMAAQPHVVGIVQYAVTSGSIPTGLAENADGIDLDTPGMIALLTSDGIRNGPWVVQAGDWIRPFWYPTGARASSAFVHVDGGSGNAGQVWHVFTVAPNNVIDTHSITWQQKSAPSPTSYGDASHIAQFSFNPEGRINIAGQVAVAIDGTAVTSGTLPAGRMPALTGDVTSSAGSAATTVVNVAFAVVQTSLGAASGAVSVNSQKITNLATPTSGTDGATKAYVDARSLGIRVLTPALTLATSAVGTLSGLSTTVSGVALNTDGQRVVLTAESSAVNNGPWLVHSGAWTRPTDFAAGSSAAGAFMLITAGTFAGTTWACTAAAGSDVVGTDNLPFAEFAVPGSISAGDSTITVVGTAITRPAITGDISIPSGSNTGTLATVASAGSAGDASHSVALTINAKGLVTSLAAVAIAIDATKVTSGNLASARLPVANTAAVLFGKSGGGYDSDAVIVIDNANHRLGVNQATPVHTVDVTGDARVTTNVIVGGAATVAGAITAGSATPTSFILEAHGMTRLGGQVGINQEPDHETFCYLQTQTTGNSDRVHIFVGGAGTALAGTGSQVAYADWDASITNLANGATFGALWTHRFRAQIFSATSGTVTDNAPATVVIDGPPSFVSGMGTPANTRALRVKAGNVSIDTGSLIVGGDLTAGAIVVGSTTITATTGNFAGSVGAGTDLVITRDASVGRNLTVSGNFAVWGSGGFASKPVVTGSRGGNAALASLLGTLATYGLITDSST